MTNTKEIAIFKAKGINTYDDYAKIIDSITDWTEVSQKDYEILTSYSYVRDWIIIERLDRKEDFIPKTVKVALEEAREFEKKQQLAKETEEKKKQDRLLKKKAKDEVAEKKLLEHLLAKHGENN